MSTHETRIGIVIMEYDKKPRAHQMPFRVLVNKMSRALNKRLKKPGLFTPGELALIAAYTLLPKGTGAPK